MCLAEEQRPRDGGEGQEAEEEEHGAVRSRQEAGGESSETAGGQPQSGMPQKSKEPKLLHG